MSKKALGIDLGTTNSAMAIVKNDQPEIIPMGANDEAVLRSALYFSSIGGHQRTFFGKDAINRGTETGKIEFFKQDFKRDIGKSVESETPDHTRLNSVILSALILQQFKKRADIVAQELHLTEGISDAVITVPAYFTSEQRAATKNAGILAGLNVLRIINEPTAAAISYAHKKNISGNILVYDLGGGTFDVTVMRVDHYQYDILATDGNHRLGGLDFDKRIVKFLKQKLEEQGLNMTGLTPKEEVQLRYQAEKIKIALSVEPVAFYERWTKSGEYGVEITQEDFRAITEDLLKDTQIKVQSTLQASQLEWSQIDHILLVGGSTRMLMVRQMIRELSGQEPRYDLNPDTIVAEGASIIADLLVNQKVSFNESHYGEGMPQDHVVVRDVTSQGIGLLFRKTQQKTYPFGGDYYNSVVVPRNTSIPATVEKDVFAVVDGQDNFGLRVTEGNSANPLDVKIILQEVVPVGYKHRKGNKIATVCYAFDPEQIIHVTIYDANRQVILKEFSLNTTFSQVRDERSSDLSELKALFDRFKP